MRLVTLRRLAFPLSILFLPIFAPLAAAQDPPTSPNVDNPLYAFSLEVPEPQQTVLFGENKGFPFVVRDLSRDGSPNPTLPLPPTGATGHFLTFSVVPLVPDDGWTVYPPTPRYSYAGQVIEDVVYMQALPSATNKFYEVNFTLVAQTQGGESFTYSAKLTGYSPGVKAYNVLPPPAVQLRPKQIVEVPLRITNVGLQSQHFSLQLLSADCGLNAAAPGSFVVRGKETLVVQVSLEAPARKPLYLSDQCQAQFLIEPEGSRGAGTIVTANVQVDGVYVNPQWVIWILEALAILILVLFLLARRKARIEEEILGKPQKPWLIPVEALYLRALRQKDERAWYVVRHHLMEEEYRSSLLWYKSYKKATKGSRKKETLVLRQEKKYTRWKAKWQKRIDAPLLEADKFEAKLQKKIDRRTRKADRKREKKTEAVTRKMEAAHAKKVERSIEAWQKQVRKAEKKGLEPPERPEVPEPDYPEMPEPTRALLADHKWARKAERFRARRVKEQGDLEVKFEKADARKLAKLRRKVQRLARKLDDPAFIDEHPLLRAAA